MNKKETPALANMLGEWLLRIFSKRKLCYVFFHYEEKGPDLKLPVHKVQPYLAYINPKANDIEAAPLFQVEIKKGRTVKHKKVEIVPVGKIPVV